MVRLMRRHLTASVLAFFTITPLLLVTALIRVPCPVCGGSGTVSNLPGMEGVRVLESSFKLLEREKDACGVYTVWRYALTLRLLNEGDVPAKGWLKASLLDTTKPAGNNEVDAQYLAVDMPPQAVFTSEYSVVFGTGLDEPGKTDVKVEPLLGEVPDVACGGSGRVALNALPFVSSVRTHLQEIARAESEYHPPVAIDWSDYVFFDE